MCGISGNVYSNNLIGPKKTVLSPTTWCLGQELAAKPGRPSGHLEAGEGYGGDTTDTFLTVYFESLHFLCFVLVCNFCTIGG